MGVMLAILHYGAKAIKTWITYPRTGFVDYRPRDKYWIPMALSFLFSGFFGAAMYVAARRHFQLSSVGLVVGLLLATSYIRFAKTVRWKWAVFVTIVAATFVVAALPAGLVEGYANHTSMGPAFPARTVGAYWLTFIVYGALLLISGGISMRLYLRRTRAPQQASE